MKTQNELLSNKSVYNSEETKNIQKNNNSLYNNLIHRKNYYSSNFHKSESSKYFYNNNNHHNQFDNQPKELIFNKENNNINNNFINIGEGINNEDNNIYKKRFSKIFYSKNEEVNIDKEYEKLKKENKKLKKENISLINKLKKLQSNSENYKIKLDDQQKEIISLNNKLLKLNDIIKQKNKNIFSLNGTINDYKISNNEKEKDNELLTSKILNLEKESKNNINALELLNYEQIKNKNLEKEIISVKKFDAKSEGLLQVLFDFYNNIKYLINYIPKQNIQNKENLNDIIKFESLEEFEEKLKSITKKFGKYIEENRLRICKCFPCDIACCTTKNERIKFFK